MSRCISFLLGVLVAVGLCTPRASAAADRTQFDALAACQTTIANMSNPTGFYCKLNLSGVGGGVECSSGLHRGYYIPWKDGVGGVGSDEWWCVPATCNAGTSPGGQTDYTFNDPGGAIGAGGVVDQGGCCATLALSQSQWRYPDKSDATSTGHFVLNGDRCTSSDGIPQNTTGKIPNPQKLLPYEKCKPGQRSCYNPFEDAFCAQSDSGEWHCVPKQQADAGGCISGATGSFCVNKNGEPVPTPPDPPIQKDTPSNDTGNITINNSTSSTTYNTNNYSGTSTGGQGSESGPPGSSASPGGSGSNSGGSGNSGSKGTDPNGKCQDGSVPTASGCSGTYRDDGCDTPPACHGDAVLCGIAANTHKTACKPASGASTGAPPGDYSGDPTSNGGDPAASGVSNEVDLGGTSDLDAGGFGFATSCPLQDVSFDLMGKTVVVHLADKCDKLAWIRLLVLAFAYFAAAKIIAGVK